MTITIRKMEEADVTTVTEIEAANFSQPWQYKDFLNTLTDDNYEYVVAVSDDKVVGYIGAVVAIDEADITNVAVDASYRRLGIADKLIESMGTLLNRRQVKEIFLEVRFSNESAKALYSKNGFIEVGLRKNFYSMPTEDAILMKKEITGSLC